MSQFNTPNYEIPRTTGTCAKTGRQLEPGETYYAALLDLPEEARLAEAAEAEKSAGKAKDAKTEDLGIRRVDVSQEAWEEGFRPDYLFSYWKSVVPEPNEKKKLFVDDAVLVNMLVRLEDATEPQRLAFRFVLALILMRKKLVRYDKSETRQVQVDDETVEQDWWTFTPKLDVSKGPMGKWNEDATIEVLDPHLDETQIEQVTQQLGDILEAEF